MVCYIGWLRVVIVRGRAHTGRGCGVVTAPDGNFPRPRALRRRLSRRPRLAAGEPVELPVEPSIAAAPEAWFSYAAAGDKVIWSDELRSMLGRIPGETGDTGDSEISRPVLMRHVHRDDLAVALGAITRAWTAREAVDTTVRLLRADGGWFDVDC